MIIAFALGASISAFILLYINWSKARPVLDPTRFQEFPLIDKKVLSSNTARYRFALPQKDSMLGLPIGQHLQVQVDVNGKMVQRSYTPTTSDDELGFFELVIKVSEAMRGEESLPEPRRRRRRLVCVCEDRPI